MASTQPSGQVARSERGSTLMLMPAAVLVCMVLGALAVDSANIFLAQRELVSATQAAANDSVAIGLDHDQLRSHGVYRLDPDRVQASVAASFRLHRLSDAHFTIEVGPTQVAIMARRTVKPVFGTVALLGGGPQTVTAEVTGSATGPVTP